MFVERQLNLTARNLNEILKTDIVTVDLVAFVFRVGKSELIESRRLLRLITEGKPFELKTSAYCYQVAVRLAYPIKSRMFRLFSK